jgi:putative protein kinase ArgK-like GTPase of G3E family
LKDTGIPELAEAIARHLAQLDSTGGREKQELRRAQHALDLLLERRLAAWFRARVSEASVQSEVGRVARRETSPQQAVDRLTMGLAG